MISLFIIILIVEVNYVVKCTNYIMFDEPYQDIIDTKEWFILELECVEIGCWKCKTCGIFIIQLTTFLNIIRICWKYKTCVISLYNIFEYYPNIFWILFLYVENAKQCHIHYSIFLNFIRIFLEFYSYILKCKTGVIFIIQLYIFLNIIRIF